jgi:hypothetical protein
VTTLISGVRGLSLVKTVVQIAAYGLVMWTYADRQGLGDAFVDGVKSLLGLPVDLLKMTATPGGGR